MNRLSFFKRSAMFALGGLLVTMSSLAPADDVYYRDQVAVLLYHHVSKADQSNVTITPELFGKQLAYLQHKGYHFIDMPAFQRYMKGEQVPSNAVLVTFDDSYKSIAEEALPVLEKMDVPAVNFVITQDLDGPFSSQLPSLNEADVERMSASGIDIECHSNRLHRKHNGIAPFLTTRLSEEGLSESEEEYRGRVERDTILCARRLERLTGRKINAYAYPFGSYNQTAIEELKKAGIEYGFTIVPEMATRGDNEMLIPRINAGSPGITPQTLHNTIVRQAVEPDKREDYVPLRDTFAQLGGVVIRDESGQVNLYYGEERWIVQVDKGIVSKNGVETRLAHPLIKRNKKLWIHQSDLETVTGFDIMYQPNSGKYGIRQTPAIIKKI
ncbi:Polysaccharide deacetylase [Paenibacillus sp. UNCCL117]|uniref:polysaccharide deacetylase family protein n=1 Tax=unclassified Paenibacillus TaxID=185978 RepID=UPI000885CA0C|nr:MULTISPECIES: polysaccharide deacetylase family protein [unclassified Paenibacillus]SDC07952.1 Polysaccharide deacetylase [Paenibacillus sp. cl123]SFW38158.1 Polysaccharide deacetylase [Paenibacillus sp. UNCCL117]